MTTFCLHNEDCVQAMPKLPAASIDFVVTSPPYNLGIRYSKFSDRADRAGYLHWCKTWAAEIARLLQADGSFFLNVGASPANPMFPHELVLELRNLFVLQNTIHWIKSISIDTARPNKQQISPHLNPLPQGEEAAQRRARAQASATTFGHFKPINSQRFLNDCHEYIFHLTPEGKTPVDRLALGVPYQDKSNIA